MEPAEMVTATPESTEMVAKIEQKAMRLSALLREVDNHPIELASQVRSQLDEILEMLACRVAATRALLHPGPMLRIAE